MAEFDTKFNASILLFEKVEKPCRLEGPVYLVVINLKAVEELALEAFANCHPEYLKLMQRSLAKGDEITCIFSNTGEEIERHCLGVDYVFSYENVKF